MFQTRCYMPTSNFRSMWRAHSTLPLLRSSVSWWGTQRAQRLHTPRWWRVIRFKLSDDRLTLSFVSFSVICGSSLIRHSHLATFFSPGSNSPRLAATFITFKSRSAKLKSLYHLWTVDHDGDGPQRSFTNFTSIAGNTSTDNNRNTSMYENLSEKVFLYCREIRHPSQTFCRLEQVWPIGRACFLVCHSYEDSALCVGVKKFVVTSPDFAHPEMYGVLFLQCRL